jgi:hypothetical protein
MGEGKQAPARHGINFALMIAIAIVTPPISTIVSPAYIQQFESVNSHQSTVISQQSTMTDGATGIDITVMTDTYRVG